MLDPHKAQQVADATRAEKAGKSDRVELSDQGQVVHKLTASRTDSRERAAQVAELKALYERGELEPDNKATATAMVDSGLFDDLIGDTAGDS